MWWKMPSDYYKFGKVHVLDISRHLTSKPGMLTYVTRDGEPFEFSIV